jgi:hypothetical protein
MEVNEAYDILEKIIVQGFLHDYYDLKGNRVVLKTLNEIEYNNLNFYVGVDSEDRSIYELVFSTLMIDGINVLSDRDDKIKDVYSMYLDLDTINYDKIRDKVRGLQVKYLKSLKFLEGFCYTDKSRFLWKGINSGVLATEKLTGLHGTGNLGINSVQNNWVVVNRRLDSEDEFEKSFNLAILIASSFNSKGSKSVSRSFESQRDELKEVRKGIAKFGYDKLRYEKERSLDGWSMPIKSRSDLVRELDKQIKGEKDKHDLFIEEWLIKQKELAEAASQAVEEKRIKYRESLEVREDINTEGSRLATSEEILRLNDRRNFGIQEESAVTGSLQEKQAFIKKVSSVVLKSDR